MAEMTLERLEEIERFVWRSPSIDTNPPSLLMDINDVADLITALRQAWIERDKARKELVFDAQEHMADVMGCKTNGHVPDIYMTSCVNCRTALSGLEWLRR